MSKKSKVILAVFIPLFIITLIAYLIILSHKPVEYPPSSLVYSIFTAENNEYHEKSDFEGIYELINAPYTIDVPVCDAAHVGNGIVYNIDPETLSFIYISEITNFDQLNETILGEFPKAVIYDYTKNSYVEDIVSDSGYINGFAASYFIKRLNITDDIKTKDVYMIGYVLLVPDSEDLLLVSATTSSFDSSSLEHIKKISDALLYTVRYSEELDKQRQKALEEALKEEKKESESNDEIHFDDEDLGSERNEGNESSELPTVPDNAEVEIKSIDISTDYDDSLMVITWENANTMISARLTDESGVIYYDASKYDLKTAYIELGYIEKGTYILEITGLDYGNISVNVIENTDNTAGIDDTNDSEINSNENEDSEE